MAVDLQPDLYQNRGTFALNIAPAMAELVIGIRVPFRRQTGHFLLQTVGQSSVQTNTQWKQAVAQVGFGGWARANYLP